MKFIDLLQLIYFRLPLFNVPIFFCIYFQSGDDDDDLN